MRTLLIVGLLAFSLPAHAESCFTNGDGVALRFLDDGENGVAIQTHDGVELTCSWAVTPNGPDVQDIQCVGGLGGGFHFDEASPKGRVMIFQDQTWSEEPCEAE